MSMEASAKAIFVTNTFAQAHPEEHIKLWKQFENEVPASKRSGAYGVENMAYVRWLKKLDNPIVREFLRESIIHQ
ncbi:MULTISPECIES: hypothetical protein [Bacillus subtilis group]|uniref:Uncharacterized protein n=2 Tax=Bacillus subtilis group TaxID=653685 RepID=A0A8I1WDD7_BACIU|nr:MULTISPECIES: hypothetical protein [Bacillus subtilis group]KAF2421774.1 hypothetical protein B6K89_21540 [Bacillus subtilis]MBO3794359.1 hypothetical protein [Bacillus subtilis]MCY9186468.1 hypothetical protein [Bacillus halotolerans]